MEVSLFYLIHPAYSSSCKNTGILMRFQCFFIHPADSNSRENLGILARSQCFFAGKTVKTTTDQRNLSIIGRDQIKILKKKRRNVVILLMNPNNNNKNSTSTQM